MVPILRNGFVHVVILLVLAIAIVAAVLIVPKYLPNISPKVTPLPITDLFKSVGSPNPTSNLSYLEFAIRSDEGKLLLTNQDGLSTGFDYKTGKDIDNIPNSEYSLDEYYGNATNNVSLPPPTEGVIFLTLDNPKYGIYLLEIIGNDGDNYSVDVYISSPQGELDTIELTGIFVSNSVKYKFEYLERNENLKQKLDFQLE